MFPVRNKTEPDPKLPSTIYRSFSGSALLVRGHFVDKDDAKAVVTVKGGSEIMLRWYGKSGEKCLIHAPDPNSKTCVGQKLCIAGYFHDQAAIFDVFVDGVKHNCVADNWSGQ